MICACDGLHYPSICHAQSMRVDVSRFGGCLFDDSATEFICGEQSCAQHTYCSIAMNDVANEEEPEFYATCAELPEICRGDEVPTCERCFMPDSWSTCVEIGEQLMIVYSGG